MKNRIDLQKMELPQLTVEVKKILLPAWNSSENNSMDNNTSIKIKPTKPRNIMIDIFYNLNSVLPQCININFYTEKEGAYSSDVIYPSWHCGHYQIKNNDLISSLGLGENVGALKIVRTNDGLLLDNNGLVKDYLVNEINFSAQNLSNDFTFVPFASFKYVYRVLATGYKKDFCMEKGNCAHDVGDSFEDGYGNQLTVMKIDHIEGIVYCSATGFLSF